MKIAHCADLHIRGRAYHTQYRQVFESCFAKWRELKVDYIFIAGDIFHTKTQGITPESIEFLSWLFTSMAEIAPLHMMLGNHDGSLKNLSRQDAISPIVSALNNPKIHLYKKSGIYEFTPGWNWCVFSLFDEENWDKIKPIPGKINIACFHGSIRGAVTDMGFELDGNVTANRFEDFTVGILGDIHKQQFLGLRDTDGTINGAKPWIGYSSSLIQQNYGESVDGHGFLLWDIKSFKDWDVKFHEVPNPNPFVTTDWTGSVAGTLILANQFPDCSRFRIKSDISIPQHSIRELIAELKERKLALEVTFKIDEQKINNDVITTETMSVLKGDLHNVTVQLQLMHDYYRDVTIIDEEWKQIEELLISYNEQVIHDESPRNVKWRIKSLEFDNLFGYGEGNIINFDNIRGITGIFGKNRSGKSSIVGSLLYALFNDSDRGSLKNIEMVKSDKDWGSAKACISINGVDHIIARRTTKGINKKKNEIYANTNLELTLPDGSQLTGEQRTETDSVIRSLIGTGEDFRLTSLSTQGDIDKFISEGSTRRRLVVSKFLDVDFFDRLYDISKKDQMITKALLKEYPQKDWSILLADVNQKYVKSEEVIRETEITLESVRTKFEDAKTRRKVLGEIKFVTPTDLDDLGDKISNAEAQVVKTERDIFELKKTLTSKQIKYHENVREQDVLGSIELLQIQVTAIKTLEKQSNTIAHELQLINADIARKKKSIAVLSEVPCGDSFPTCKFIKTAHVDRLEVSGLELKAANLSETLAESTSAISELSETKPLEKLDKLGKITQLIASLNSEIAVLESKLTLREKECKDYQQSLDVLMIEYHDLEKRVESNRADQLAVADESVMALSLEVKKLDSLRLRAAEIKGMCEAESTKLAKEKYEFESLSRKLKIQDLVTSAYSKKGIPNLIIDRQLPLINAEIAKILYGIVDFTIELKSSLESTDMPVYINYGDEPRIIELGSGMEKMIASLAIRVALFNISTLPKSDMLIIDEGFGVLDDPDGVESAIRLLQSLKQFFHSIIVITHVDMIKEAADDIIEITRTGKDAKVVYE